MEAASPSILAIIPARAGSKGVPNKNLRIVHGKPLIAHSVQFANSSGAFSHVLVSTDSPEIARTAESYGGWTPWLRPSHLASDSASTEAVVRFELEKLAESQGLQFNFAVILQPTSPIRRLEDLTQVVDLISNSADSKDSVISVAVSHLHPSALHRAEKDILLPYFPDLHLVTRRQDGVQSLEPTGAFFAINVRKFLERGSIYGGHMGYVVTPNYCNIDVDTEADLVCADALLKWEGSHGVFR